MPRRIFASFLTMVGVSLVPFTAGAVDQSVPGAGNDAAAALAGRSPIVRSARSLLAASVLKIKDGALRATTFDATQNESTCVKHRAGVDSDRKTALLAKLAEQGLVDPADDTTFPSGLRAGVFPPLKDDGECVPSSAAAIFSAPGSVYGGHHSYPGGLPIHESFNELNDANIADTYRQIYGHSRRDGLPQIGGDDSSADDGFFIDQDIIVGAPLWHDWAKPIVFQWNSDGSEFAELNFGGNGTTDNYGAAGNSKGTGAHHILGVAETMKRGLSPGVRDHAASAHSNPTSRQQVRGW